MKRFSPLFLAMVFWLTSNSPLEAHILDLKRGTYVSFADMLSDLGSVRVVFMGELHDNPGHHRAQLQVIRALQKSGAKLAIGLEMFRKDSQGILDRWVGGEIDKKEFLKTYYDNWSMWPAYRDIFTYARKNRIKMLGLNLSRRITSQVASGGMTSLTPEQLGELPGVRCEVSPAYREYIRRTLGKHVHMGAGFEHFCEAQMLWDAVMARTLMDFLGNNPEHIVVVLAGSGHAWQYGIPEQLRQLGEGNLRVLLPEIPGRIEAATATGEEGDYLMIGLEQGALH